MAGPDKKRFPSPANVDVKKDGSPAPAAKGPVLAKAVQAKSVKTTRVQYDGENHVILHNGVHHLQKGLNHVPTEVLEESLKHPNLQALKKSGKLTILDGEELPDEPAEDMGDEAPDGAEKGDKKDEE